MTYMHGAHDGKPDTFVVEGKDDIALDALLARYDAAKADLDEAKAKMESLTSEVKNWVTGQYVRHASSEHGDPATPHERYALTSRNLRAPLTLTWTVRRTVDTSRLRAELPAIANAYLKTSGFWMLKRVS